MRPWDAIETAQMSFCLVPEVLNPVDVVSAIRKKLRMIDPYVMEVRNMDTTGNWLFWVEYDSLRREGSVNRQERGNDEAAWVLGF